VLAKAREATVSQGKDGDEEAGDVEASDIVYTNQSVEQQIKKDNPSIGSWAFYWDEQAIRDGGIPAKQVDSRDNERVSVVESGGEVRGV
jgi:hypothetical protein